MNKELELTFRVKSTNSGFAASSVAPEGLAILVTADSFSKLKKEIKEAIDFYAEGESDDQPLIKEIKEGNYTINYNISVKDFLFAFTPMVGKTGLAEMTGISDTQFWRYQHSNITPRDKQKQKIKSALDEFGSDLQRISFV